LLNLGEGGGLKAELWQILPLNYWK